MGGDLALFAGALMGFVIALRSCGSARFAPSASCWWFSSSGAITKELPQEGL